MPLALLKDFLRDHTIELTGLGEPADLWDRISPHAAIKLFERAAQIHNDALFGFRLGLTLEPRHLGALGYALLFTNSVADALQLSTDFSSLVDQLTHFAFESVDAEHFRLGVAANTDYGPPVFFECGLAMGMKLARLITNTDIWPTRIELPYPRPAHPTELQTLLPCELRFERPAPALIYNNHVLHHPTKRAEAPLVAILRTQLDQSLSALRRTANYEVRLGRHIADVALQGRPSLAAVARQAGTTPANIAKQLSDEGRGFRDLRNATLQQQAETLLRDRSKPLAHIASLLGYGELSSFTRAFRRWTGLSPTAWRRRALSDTSVPVRKG